MMHLRPVKCRSGRCGRWCLCLCRAPPRWPRPRRRKRRYGWRCQDPASEPRSGVTKSRTPPSPSARRAPSRLSQCRPPTPKAEGVSLTRLENYCVVYLATLESREARGEKTILNSSYPTPVEKGRICASCLGLLGSLPCLCSLQRTKRRVSVHASHGRGSKLAVELRLPSRSTMHQRKQKACAS